MKSSRSAPALLPEAERFGVIQRFQSEAAEIRYAPEPLRARLTLYVLATFLIAMVGGSTLFQIDREVSSDSGKVVTVQPNTVLQALDPSIIKSIDVHEGDLVKANQVLATLDPTLTAADVTASRLQADSLNAQIARASAELAHAPYDYPTTEQGRRNPYTALQSALYEQRKRQFDAQVEADNEQIAQTRGTITRLKADMGRYEERAAVAAQVVQMRAELNAHFVGSKLDLLSATDNRLEMLRDLEADKNQLVETEHQLAAAIDNRDVFIRQWDSQTSQELLTARNSLDTTTSQLIKAGRHNELVDVRAPDDAVVLSLSKVSVGSVLKEGDPLIELATMTSPVQAEIQIGARDVGFVRPGDEATIKFDAFQFVEHGSATGRLLWISDGTFNTDASTGTNTDTLGRPVPPYYKARIEFTSVNLHNVPDSFRLVPGMTLSADIHVGTRSLFMYLVRGVVRTVDEAMREP